MFLKLVLEAPILSCNAACVLSIFFKLSSKVYFFINIGVKWAGEQQNSFWFFSGLRWGSEELVLFLLVFPLVGLLGMVPSLLVFVGNLCWMRERKFWVNFIIFLELFWHSLSGTPIQEEWKIGISAYLLLLQLSVVANFSVVYDM